MSAPPDATRVLLADYQAGDILAGAALLRLHEGLVHSAVQRFVTERCEFDDLLQVGREELVLAARAHDDQKGEFSSYAYYRMMWAASRYARRQRFVVEVPDRKALRAEVPTPLYLDAPLHSGGTMANRLPAPAPDEPPPDATPLVARLHGREREAIERHYSEVEETLEQIGDSWGVSKEWVRRVRDRALEKMRRTAQREAA